MPDAYSYYGDMSWFAAVTTTDRRVVSVATTLVAALRRYYLDELWRGRLPAAIEELVMRSLAALEREGGSRRGGPPAPLLVVDDDD